MQRMSSSMTHSNLQRATKGKLVPVHTQPPSSSSSSSNTNTNTNTNNTIPSSSSNQSPINSSNSHRPRKNSNYSPDDLTIILGESRRLQRSRTASDATREHEYVRHDRGPLGFGAPPSSSPIARGFVPPPSISPQRRPTSNIESERLSSSLPRISHVPQESEEATHNFRLRYYRTINVVRPSEVSATHLDEEESEKETGDDVSYNPVLNYMSTTSLAPTRSRRRSQSDSTGLRSMQALEDLKERSKSKPLTIPSDKRKGKFDIDFKPSLDSETFNENGCILDGPTFVDHDEPFEMEMD